MGWRRLDVTVLAALLLLTAVFGRSFSRLGWDGGSIYITEVALAVIGVVALKRIGVRSSLELVRDRLPQLALVALIGAGLVATVRGVLGPGLSLTLDDIGIFEYSLVLPLAVLVADTAQRRDQLFMAMVYGGLGATLTFGFADLLARAVDADPILGDQQGLIGFAGLYVSIFLAWICARLAHGVGPVRPQLVAALGALTVIGLTDKRSAWLAALMVLAVVILFSPAGRRRVASLAATGLVVVATGLTFAVELALGPAGEPPAPATAAQGLATTLHAGAGSGAVTAALDAAEEGAAAAVGVSTVAAQTFAPAPPDSSGTQLGKELTGLGFGDSVESENLRWRLDYWRELLDRSVETPLFGVGFGEPSRFVWMGRKYDFRSGLGTDVWSNVTGSHNAFIDMLYRTGIFGLLGLAALIAVAFARLRSALAAGPPRTGRRTELVALTASLAAAVTVISLNDAMRGPFLALFFWVTLAIAYAWAADETAASAGPETSRD